jgi:N-acetylglucosaminyldiphosphoundecaprenol N-acetyl-beta-D-mannosaminyltransferase
MEEAVARGCEMIRQGGSHYVVTPNSEIIYQARTNEALKTALLEADMALPDGIGVVYAGKILGAPVKEKVAGIEFGTAMLRKAAEEGWSVFFLGAKPGVAQLAGENMMAQIPGLRMAGCADGYFKEDGPVVEQIRASGADILFVCLGAPKQELWMAKNGKATGAKLMCGLGGSLDIFAGVSQRAPEIWVKLGLEWAYRLVKEPFRIGRMMNLPKFLFTAIGMRITGKR